MRKRLSWIAVIATACVASTVLITTQAFAEGDPFDWKTCGDKPGAECASFAVPRDWDDPDGESIALNITRRAATDPDERIGALFYNPGGPGVGAADMVRDYASEKFSPQLLERFDLIGIDPRGVGGSQRLKCEVPVHDPEVSQFPTDSDSFSELVEHNSAVADSCDDLIADVGTDNVVRDFEAVREGLGEQQITYFGQSYGSILGTNYAERFPERVRAMSLDGIVDHSMPADDMVVDAAAAVERSFENFVSWCDEDTECAWNGTDVARRWDNLVALAEAEPIPVTDAHAMTAEELRYSVYAMLNLMPEFGPQMSEALEQAENGDATTLGQVRYEAMESPVTTPAYRSVLCMDIDPGVDGHQALADRMRAAENAAPHMRGTSEFWDMTAGCLGWPYPPSNPQHDIDIDGLDSALLVGNTGDPATPVEWAERLSGHIERSRVLTYDGDGHTAYQRSDCATERIDDYLVSGDMPDTSTCESGT